MTQVTLLQRITESNRIETDIPAAEIQRIIDYENSEVVARFGPHANPLTPITVTVSGGDRTILLARPIDTSQTTVIVESWRSSFGGAVTQTTLDANDYKIWHGGRTVERLFTGTHPGSRWGCWAGSSAGWADITYTPQNDGNAREEVIIKLVLLTLEYDGKRASSAGGVYEQGANFQDERERLLNSLAPRGILFR